MHLDSGKRQTRVLNVACDRDSGNSKEKITAMRVYCTKTRIQFLVDTGASLSCLPATAGNRSQGPDAFLTAANGSNIATYGRKTLMIELGLRRDFEWNFTIADVTMPILGIDFLSHYGLTINLKNMILLDPTTSLTTNATRARLDAAMRIVGTGDEIPDRCRALLKKYSVITEPETLKHCPPHSTVHYIPTKGPPLYNRPRRLAPDKLAIAKSAFDELLRLGIVRPSRSPWAAPLHLVPKGEGWRITTDFRRLNYVSQDDRHGLPHVHDFAVQVGASKYFTKLDLHAAYYAIPVNEADIPKTAVTTPFGLFEYTRLPFGLKGAPQTFQRFMNEVLRGIDNAYAYIDDVLITSETEDEHYGHIEAVFKRLQTYGLVINMAKCKFVQESLEFLGHQIGRDGIKPLPSKVAAIKDYPKPADMHGLRRFLGMVNYYHRFLPQAAETLAPINDLLKPKRKGTSTVVAWTPEAEKAFMLIKIQLANYTALKFPAASAQLSVVVDASAIAAGAVLQQTIDGRVEPLAFFSRRFTKTEIKYSTFSRELLAAYLAVKHFKYALQGTQFSLYTDHQPITKAIQASNLDKHSPREARHLSYILEFTSDVRYIRGRDNQVADALSRASAINVIGDQGITLEELANAHLHDEELKSMVDEQFEAYQKGETYPYKLECRNGIAYECSKPQPRPFIPKSMRERYIRSQHDLAHPGIRRTVQMIKEKAFWPNMSKNIRKQAQMCQNCQSAKITRHNKAPLQQFAPVSDRFKAVHMDIVGPLPYSNGYRYLLTIIDRYSRWPEAIPIVDSTAETVAKAFLMNWVARYGVPETLATDRGANFEGELTTSLCKLLGIRKIRTTSYHPQANGIIERFHRTLKSSLKCQQNPQDWHTNLPLVLLGLRTAPKAELDCSVAEMLYGSTLRVPGDLVEPSDNNDLAPNKFAIKIRHAMANLKFHAPKWTPIKGKMDPALQTCTHAYIRVDSVQRPLTRPYEGPYRVVKRGAKTFKLLKGSKVEVVSIDRIKSATMLPETVEDSTSATAPPKQLSECTPVTLHRVRFSEPLEHVETQVLEQHVGSAANRPPTKYVTTRSGRRVKPPARFADIKGGGRKPTKEGAV